MMIHLTNIRWLVLLVLTVLLCTGVGCRTLPSHAPSTSEKEPDDLRIHFFNVGVGAMALVECPADSLGRPSRPILIDGGSVSRNTTFSWPISYVFGLLGNHPNKEMTRRKLKHILNGRKIDLIITHPHLDHANWISGLLDGVQVKHILLGGELKEYKSPIDVKKWIVEKGYLSITHFFKKEGWHNGGKPLGDNAEEPKIKGFGCGPAEVYVLTVNSPEVDFYPEKSLPNLRSAVILIQYNDFRAIFPGDAEGSTEKTALANLKYFKDLALDDSTSLPITVLAAAHHGTDTAHSNHPAWVEATKPKVIVYSAGAWYGHPRCTTTERYRKSLLKFDQEHLFQCGKFGTVASLSYFIKSYSKQAEFVTHLNGDVVITTKGRSYLRLEYGLSERMEEIVRY